MMENKKQKSPVEPQVHGDTIEDPTVNIGAQTIAEDAVAIAIRPIEYRTVKGSLKLISMQLKNAEVAYMGSEIIKIARCIGYYYNKDKASEDALKKALADALSHKNSAVVLFDKNYNTYVALLETDVLYRDIHTADDFSSPYGGLTYLQTRGKKHVSSLRIQFLITSDKHLLIPVSYPLDYMSSNACYTRINENIVYEADDIIHIISQIKSGNLQSYIRGHDRVPT